MKRKNLFLLCMLILCFGLFGCGDDSVSETESYSDDSGSTTYYDSDYNTDYSDEANFGDYDYDGNGDISTDEFQDATEDWMDSYESDYGYDDYDNGGDLGDYDYNGDNDISNSEFQDAVNDYMDENGW